MIECAIFVFFNFVFLLVKNNKCVIKACLNVLY
jgi:hypothetical protein